MYTTDGVNKKKYTDYIYIDFTIIKGKRDLISRAIDLAHIILVV